MDLIIFYFRKLFTILKKEVLVLPSRVVVILFFLFVLLLPVLPVIGNDPYMLRIFTLTCIYAIFAASWDLLSGYTGQMNFGHALFFGVGAYSAALLNHHIHIPPWGSIPIGALVAVLAGLIIGVPCLRLKGTYLALTTLAFPIILIGIVFAFPDKLGGELGISGIERIARSKVISYYIIAITMLGLCTIMWAITDSKLGIIFHAIREDEIAVRTAGINTTRYKLLAFSLSGFFAGVAGGLYAHYMRIAGPSTLEVSLSFQVVIWSIFGGIVSIYGPIGAVFVLFPMLELLRFWEQGRTLMFACIIILILLYMPDGLFPWLRDKIEKECPRCKKRNFWRRKTCRICTAELD